MNQRIYWCQSTACGAGILRDTSKCAPNYCRFCGESMQAGFLEKRVNARTRITRQLYLPRRAS